MDGPYMPSPTRGEGAVSGSGIAAQTGGMVGTARAGAQYDMRGEGAPLPTLRITIN
ncbi:protein of unknown function, Doubtful CDS [Bradyrhizobium sp. ORS 285]|nr:protein of unknown function, Doubtful CDS [Bradyrhizobium sp. ORS 285]